MKKPVRYEAGFFVTSTCLTKRETSAVIQRQSFDSPSTLVRLVRTQCFTAKVGGYLRSMPVTERGTICQSTW